MSRRGAVVQRLNRLYSRESELAPVAAIKFLIAVADVGDTHHWSEGQMNALRYCASSLRLSDEDLKKLDVYFDREITNVLGEHPALSARGAADLSDLLIVVAAPFPDERHDDAYAGAICAIPTRFSDAYGRVVAFRLSRPQARQNGAARATRRR